MSVARGVRPYLYHCLYRWRSSFGLLWKIFGVFDYYSLAWSWQKPMCCVRVCYKGMFLSAGRHGLQKVSTPNWEYWNSHIIIKGVEAHLHLEHTGHILRFAFHYFTLHLIPAIKIWCEPLQSCSVVCFSGWFVFCLILFTPVFHRYNDYMRNVAAEMAVPVGATIPTMHRLGHNLRFIPTSHWV